MNLVLGAPIKISFNYLGQFPVSCYFKPGDAFDRGLLSLQTKGREFKGGKVKIDRDVYANFFDRHCEKVEGVSIPNPSNDGNKLVDVMTRDDWQAQLPKSLKLDAVSALSSRDRLDEDDEED